MDEPRGWYEWPARLKWIYEMALRIQSTRTQIGWNGK